MKIARIVLTATMLLSLKSTLFCSSEKNTESQLQRKDSFDPARDGNGWGKAIGTKWFGMTPKQLAQYTLEHCGEDYKGKQIRPGSSQESIDVWNNQIKTLEYAQNFVAAIKPVENVISALVRKKADDLIEAEKQAMHAANIVNMHKINQDAINKLAAYSANHKLEPVQDSDLIKHHQLSCAVALQIKQKDIARNRANEKTQLVDGLLKNFKAISVIEAEEKTKFPEKFVIKEESITNKKIISLANKYEKGKPKITTFIEALKGEK